MINTANQKRCVRFISGQEKENTSYSKLAEAYYKVFVIITDKLEGDADMYRQRRMLYVQANMLVRKFHYWCFVPTTPLCMQRHYGSATKKETLRKIQAEDIAEKAQE